MHAASGSPWHPDSAQSVFVKISNDRGYLLSTYQAHQRGQKERIKQLSLHLDLFMVQWSVLLGILFVHPVP